MVNIPLSIAQTPQFQLRTIKLRQPDDDASKCSLKYSSHEIIHNAQIN